MQMKKQSVKMLCVIMLFVMCFGLVACSANEATKKEEKKQEKQEESQNKITDEAPEPLLDIDGEETIEDSLSEDEKLMNEGYGDDSSEEIPIEEDLPEEEPTEEDLLEE